MKQFIGVVAFLFANALTLSAWGHGGEDHAHPEASPVPTVPTVAMSPMSPMSPRASAASEEFEIVAVLGAKTLLLTLDRYASNAPVADARVEVESGKSTWVARQTAPGVYAIPAEPFAAQGKYPLLISVQAGETSDLLAMTLDLSQTIVNPPEHSLAPAGQRWNNRLLWSGAAVVAIAGIALLAILAIIVKRLRKRQTTENKG